MPVFVRTQQIAHDIGPKGRFALRVTSPEVHLRALEGGRASVGVTFELRAGSDAEADEIFERVRYRVRQGDGVLELSEPKDSMGGLGSLGSIVRMFGGGAAVADVSVGADVPAEAELAYNGVSADVDATGFRGAQEYHTVSGDLVLERVSGELRVRGVSSDVSIRSDAALRLEMNTVSGDISAVAPRFDALRIVTVSGDVELDGSLAPQGPHRVETVSGDLALGLAGGITVEVRGLSSDTHVSLPHRSEGSRDRRRYVVGDGAGLLQFSSMSGDVRVNPSRRAGPTQPTPPTPPTAPTPPTPPTAPTPPMQPAAPVSDEEQLEILRAVEAGEITVTEASERLAGRRTDA